MKRILTFKKYYFIWTIILLIVEIGIARFAHDQFVRPYLGDVLVVILIYCFVQAFLNTPVFPTALAVLLFCYFIEALQYIRIVNTLGLQDNPVARTMIGTSFEWSDIMAYTCGYAIVLSLEYIISKKKTHTGPAKTIR